MRDPLRTLPVLIAAASLFASCGPRPTGTPWAQVQEVTPPFLASGGSADPSLAVEDGGRVALTWVTRDDSGSDAWLSVSADSGSHWTTPVRLNPFRGRVSSFAESRPIAAWGRDGLLVAAWASQRGTRNGGDDLGVRASADGGRTWGAMSLVNDDRSDPTSGYHGFAAIDVLPDGRPIVAWIDGRTSAGLADEPALAEIYASTSADGGATWSGNTWVAGDVCACCRLAMKSARQQDGSDVVAIAYRGALDDLRDPRIVLSRDAGRSFTLDTLVSPDHWKLPGCPSVGPALTLGEGGGHYMWFTGHSPADESVARLAPGVYLVPWRVDAGASGARHWLADSLGDVSRPMLASLGRATLVGAIGQATGLPSRKVLAVRRLEPDGALTRWLYLGSGVKSAAIAAQGASGAWAAWAEQGEGRTRVRVARLAGR